MKYYGQHSIPGYFDRLSHRSGAFNDRKAAILRNLDTVHSCVTELEATVDEMISLLHEYRSKAISALFTVKKDLEREINEAFTEFEDCLYWDNPKIERELTRKLRKSEAEKGDFDLFSYEIEGKGLQMVLESMLKYQVGQGSGEKRGENEGLMAGIDGKSVSKREK